MREQTEKPDFAECALSCRLDFGSKYQMKNLALVRRGFYSEGAMATASRDTAEVFCKLPRVRPKGVWLYREEETRLLTSRFPTPRFF